MKRNNQKSVSHVRGNMRFAKKYKKSLKKMQANNSKAMSTCVEAVKTLIRSKEAKANIPKGSRHKVSGFAYTAHPKFGKRAYACITKVSGSPGANDQG
ncbi:60S ribosomal protein L29 [Galemys pyrenaicus]|uniref:60S ribosomal protein L29 n=1 Tax=Galemys pyrenaicus TaxID=202257 RepID=A0A8J6DFE5_GALPY|nr:60S ribosomal protein L29 [Galemys pyrenaicus]